MQKASAPPDLLFKLLKAEIEKARREREYGSDPPRQLGTLLALHTEDRHTTPASSKAKKHKSNESAAPLSLSMVRITHSSQRS